MDNDFSDVVKQFFADLDQPATLLALFDYLPDVFLYVKDTQGRFIKVNRTLLRTRGLESEREILGKTDIDIHPPHWGARYLAEDQRVMRDRVPLVDQVWLVPNAQGRLESFISTKIPLFDPAGRCLGIAGVRRPLAPSEPEARPLSGIAAAVREMAERYGEPLEMKDLAAVSGFSHSQFNRRFRAIYRMTPTAYLQRVRVHEASRRLAESEQSIGDIALATGFYDQAHLTRTFRSLLNITPREFRRIKQ